MVKLSMWKLLIADLFLAVFFVSVWNWKKNVEEGSSGTYTPFRKYRYCTNFIVVSCAFLCEMIFHFLRVTELM